MKKNSSIVLMVLGAAVFMFGTNMSEKVALGEQKISQGEENAEGYRRPVVGPVRRNARDQASETGQEKLAQIDQTFAQSDVSANWLRGIGIVLFAVGIGSVLCCRKQK